MNSNAVYFSPTKNTKKIVRIIAQELGTFQREIDITLPENRKTAAVFQKDDIIVVGVPVYAGRVPKLVVPFLKKLKGNHTKAVAVVTYGVRAYEDALLELTDILNACGMHVIGAATFIGEHSAIKKVGTGRPDRDDLAVAADFGKKIKEKLDTGNIIAACEVKGNRPYVVKPKRTALAAPKTDEKCIQCGLCAANCPAGAISKKNCRFINVEKCIACYACVRNCPEGAKDFCHESVLSTKKMLNEKLAGVRKEVETFMA